MRIYLDSAAVIYIVEQATPYADLLDARLADREVVTVTSDLTRLECRVKPLRDQNIAVLRDFDDYFEGVFESIVPLSREVIDLATDIRARYGFKTPDSIQLAAAIWSHCDIFLTNDSRLDRFRELTVEVIQG